MKLIVTRPEGQEHELVARLETLGHEVVHCPLIRVEPLGDTPIDVAEYDWVVVTSPNGARELLRRARGQYASRGRDRAGNGGGDGARRSRRPRLHAGGPAGGVPPPSRTGARGGRGGGATRSSPTGSTPTSSRSTARTSSGRSRPPRETSACSPRRRLPALFGALGTGIPAVSIGPETTRAARAAGNRGPRRGRHARRRRPDRGGHAGVVATPRARAYTRAVFVMFLSDFGLQDDFVGTCHGVIKRIAPQAQIIDITHGIPPQAVLAGRTRAREHAAVHAGRCPSRGRRSGSRRPPSRAGPP